MSSNTITPQRAEYLQGRLSSLMRIREFRAVLRRAELFEVAKEDLLDLNRLQAKQLTLDEVYISRLKEKLESTEAEAQDELKETDKLVERLKKLQHDQATKACDLEEQIVRLTEEITEAERCAEDLAAEKYALEDRVEELEEILEKTTAEKERAEFRVADLEEFLEEKEIEYPRSPDDSD